MIRQPAGLDRDTPRGAVRPAPVQLETETVSGPPGKSVAFWPLAIQFLIGAGILVVVSSAVRNAQVNLETLGLTSGFGFLERTTGWGYSFSLIERSISDSYARTLLIGVMNTIFLGSLTIVTSTMLGVVIGTLRDVPNLPLRFVANWFVNIFRNIPLILQLIFVYSIFIHMPAPRQAFSLWDAVFLSNRGLMVPTLNVGSAGALVILVAVVAVVGLILRFSSAGFARNLLYMAFGAAAVCVVGSYAYAPSGEFLVSFPALVGLRFDGGMTIPIEFVAMTVAITVYGGAYITEVVHGGLREVPRGFVEAGRSLGLTEMQIWLKIKLPIALRSILPPLGNQWILIMKATTLGVAIGFSDLFYLVSTSITQSGQTLELIFLLMTAFLLINYFLALLVNLMNTRLALKEH